MFKSIPCHSQKPRTGKLRLNIFRKIENKTRRYRKKPELKNKNKALPGAELALFQSNARNEFLLD